LAGSIASQFLPDRTVRHSNHLNVFRSLVCWWSALIGHRAAISPHGGLPGSEIKDALFVLERPRAVKSPAELARLKKPSELVSSVRPFAASVFVGGPAR
jgi:hypothetical protein